MENLKKDIKNLIESVKKVKMIEDERKVNDIIVKSGVNLGSRLSKINNVESVQEEISKIAQKKEEIVSELEQKRAILGKNMLLTDEQRNYKIEFLKGEQEALRKRIESVSKTIENFEQKNGKDSQIADYVVLKDNRDRWKKEYEINELEIESMEIPNPQEVHDKIREIIDDVIYLNQENVDNTKLREFIANMNEHSEEKENKEEKNVKYQSVDMDLDFQEENDKKNIAEQKEEEPQEDYVKNIFEEKDKVEIRRIEISARDNYAYLVEKNENDKWNLSKIIETKDVVMRDIATKARQIGFSNMDIIKIRRRCSPVVGYILNYIQDEDVLRRYLLGIVMDKKVPFKLRYDLNNSNLDKKTFRRLNRYAKKEAQLEGVVVEGAKYNIFEKIKLRFNSNKALGDGKTYTNIKNEKNEKNVENEEKRKTASFIESIRVKLDEKNSKNEEKSEKNEKSTSKSNDEKTENKSKYVRDNIMMKALKRNNETSFKVEKKEVLKPRTRIHDNLMAQAMKEENNDER